MSEWQTIESAPKDQFVMVLAWSENDGMFIGRYTDRWLDDHDNPCEPSFWMPLPNPPKGKTNE